MAKADDAFLARWSRRKRSERESTVNAETSAPVKDAEETESTPEEAAIVEGLPDIDSLDENSDFTVFLQDGVPEALRRKALRKLWRSNPVFANLDGLNDYDEDFTLATSALTTVKTIYQVGRGMITEDDEAPVPVAAEASEEMLREAELPEETVAEAAPAPDSETESPSVTAESPTGANGGEEHTSEVPVARSGRSAMERRWGAIRRA